MSGGWGRLEGRLRSTGEWVSEGCFFGFSLWTEAWRSAPKVTLGVAALGRRIFLRGRTGHPVSFGEEGVDLEVGM